MRNNDHYIKYNVLHNITSKIATSDPITMMEVSMANIGIIISPGIIQLYHQYLFEYYIV